MKIPRFFFSLARNTCTSTSCNYTLDISFDKKETEMKKKLFGHFDRKQSVAFSLLHSIFSVHEVSQYRF